MVAVDVGAPPLVGEAPVDCAATPEELVGALEDAAPADPPLHPAASSAKAANSEIAGCFTTLKTGISIPPQSEGLGRQRRLACRISHLDY
jgi:hypothetical protein